MASVLSLNGVKLRKRATKDTTFAIASSVTSKEARFKLTTTELEKFRDNFASADIVDIPNVTANSSVVDKLL